MRPARSSAAARTSALKSARIRRVVATPTMAAKPSRITNVSTADPPARRQRIGRRLYAENVACAADRMKESALAMCLELPPQVGDEHFDGVGDGEGVIPPHFVEQALPRDDDALVAHQVLEQLELALGELDGPPAARDLVSVGIQLEVAHHQGGGAARRTPPQQRSHAGQELLALEGLDQVVVGADVEPLHAIVEPVTGGEHQDGHVVALAKLLGDVDTVQLREAEVEEDEVGEKCLRAIERG